MKYKHLLTTLALLAFSQVNANNPIDHEEDSEEKSSSFTVPNDVQIALNGMKEACRIQNKPLSFQVYNAHLLTFMQLCLTYSIDNDTAKKLMFENLLPLWNEQ